MAGHQVNVRLASDDDTELSRWAVELGVERGALGKDIFKEALAARREGRASFARPATLGPGDLMAMNAKLDSALMEIERIAKSWAAHEADMHKREREDQITLHRARTEFIAGMPERITASFNPIRAEMTAMAGRIDKQPRLDAIDGKLDQVLKAARAPRTSQTYNIGLGDWTGIELIIVGVIMLGFGMFAFHALAALLPERWLEMPTANRMLGGGDRAICRLIDYNYETGLRDCRIDIAGRKVTITASPAKAAPR